MDMMSSIQERAGRVLNEVARADRINILSVAGHLGERNLVVYQSIGWLAHEGKIRYVLEGNQVHVSLAVEESYRLRCPGQGARLLKSNSTTP